MTESRKFKVRLCSNSHIMSDFEVVISLDNLCITSDEWDRLSKGEQEYRLTDMAAIYLNWDCEQWDDGDSGVNYEYT